MMLVEPAVHTLARQLKTCIEIGEPAAGPVERV